MNLHYCAPRTLEEWLAELFEPPGEEPEARPTGEPPDVQGTRVAGFILETFAHARDLLARFSDERVAHGLDTIISPSQSDYPFALVDPTVDLRLRLDALRATVTLFEQVMAPRCSPTLSHLDERPRGALNGVCYMWWDVLPVHGHPGDPIRAPIDAEALEVLARGALRHDRVSAP